MEELGDTPEIEAAFIETNKKKHYIFYDGKTEGYYDEKAKPVPRYVFKISYEMAHQ